MLVCAGLYAVPIADSDFWWHIAAGRDILQRGGLPDTDPFGVYALADPIRSDTVLKGQWLGQVVLYGLFASGGADAVVAFRVAVLLVCLVLIYARARLLDAAGPLPLWAVLGVVAIAASGFAGERPQLLSFLFAAGFFFCVDLAWQRREGRWLWALPPLTALWANSHGGVILAVALLGLWSLVAWADRSRSTAERRRWPLAAAAVFVASLLTPNGLQTYRYLFQLEGSVLQQRTSEYVSALRLFELGFVWPQVWVVVYFLLAALGLYGLIRLRCWPQAALVGFLALISLSSYRYFAFFLFIAAPYVMWGIGRLLPARLTTLDTPLRLAVAGVLSAVLVAGIVRGSLFQGDVQAAAFPVAMADFLQRQGAQGPAFNNLEWGGYLVWRLAPRVQPYIDGRMLDLARFPPYTHMLWATPQGRRLFAASGFRLAILPWHGRFDPQRYGLIDYLDARRDWRLVYRDAQGVVFARRP